MGSECIVDLATIVANTTIKVELKKIEEESAGLPGEWLACVI